MKIVSISMVKNEEDIIESFVRYTLNIVDEMIILDNGSTDSTLRILENLRLENLPITILIDQDKYYDQDVKMTRLLYKAFDDYDADIVCVLDADEFISSDNQNPREILENIDCEKYYQVKWETYVPTEDDDYSIDFIPSRINHIRDEKFDRLYKVIVPKETIKDRNVSLEMGNHNLVNMDISPDRSLDLKIAHFPLRSKEQAMSKILVGWPNMISKHRENKQYGVHWKLFFEKIKETGEITDDDLENFGKNYSLARFEDNIEIYEKAMNISFCHDIEIKYNYYYNYLSNILENYLYYVDENIKLNEDLKSLETLNKEQSSLNSLDDKLKSLNSSDDKLKSLNSLDDELKSLNSLDDELKSLNEDEKSISMNAVKSESDIPDIEFKEYSESYLISVIIPVYNGEKYLRECLESLVNQTLGIENIEVILVDDHSSDNSVEIIKEYSAKYPSIQLIEHSDNLGCGPSRNTGLRYAHGEYISYLDCDDCISPNAYERALEILKKDEDIDLVIYKWEEFNENGLLNRNDIAKTLLKKERLIHDINDFPEIIFATYAYIKVYSKRMFEFLDYPPGYFQDNIASARVMINAKKIFVADDITVYYRQHGEQVTSNLNAEKYLNVLNASKQVIDLRDESSEHYYDILSFLALKLVYHCVWYLCKSNFFSLEEGEKLYPTLKEFPKHFSHEIIVKYQEAFPNYLPCSEQSLWDLENMDFYEYVFKNRYQNDINRLNRDNSNLRKKVKDLETKNSKLNKQNSDLKAKNSKLNKTIKSKDKKIKNKDKKIKEILNSKSWKLTSPLRKFKHIFSVKK